MNNSTIPILAPINNFFSCLYSTIEGKLLLPAASAAVLMRYYFAIGRDCLYTVRVFIRSGPEKTGRVDVLTCSMPTMTHKVEVFCLHQLGLLLLLHTFRCQVLVAFRVFTRTVLHSYTGVGVQTLILTASDLD